MKTLHIDELQEFALRDLTRLKPGAEALQLHIPDLSEDPGIFRKFRAAQGVRVTIDRVGKLPYHELEPTAPRSPGDEALAYSSYTYTDEHGNSDWRFASDAGIEPYGSGIYNGANSLVLIEDLKAAGVEVSLEASAAYQKALKADDEAYRLKKEAEEAAQSSEAVATRAAQAMEKAVEEGRIHLDEMKDLAVRNIEELTPGTEVIFVHLPDLRHPENRDSKDQAYGHGATVTEVGLMFPSDLSPHLKRLSNEKREMLILFSEGDDRQQHRYAADSGVIPYSGGGKPWYNPTNFTVLLAPLNEAGISVELDVTPDFARDLERYNSQIVVRDYDDYYPWDDEY